MCPAGLQSAVRSRQVHQLTMGTDRWLWSAERCLLLQISPTPQQNHILKPPGA